MPPHAGRRSIRPRSIHDGLLPFRILLIGYVLVHLIFEIQTRYRYFLMPAICLMAAEGFPAYVALFRLRRMRRAKSRPAIAAAPEKR